MALAGVRGLAGVVAFGASAGFVSVGFVAVSVAMLGSSVSGALRAASRLARIRANASGYFPRASASRRMPYRNHSGPNGT